MDKIQKVMSDLGFESKEIKIYLCLIKEQGMTALRISRETRIERTSIYDILEKMIDKGVVSSFVRNNSKCYNVLVPSKLLNHFKEKYLSLNGIIDDLKSVSNHKTERLNCEMFQGKEGLKIVLKNLIESKSDYKVIGYRKEYDDILGYFNDNGILKIDAIKVKERIIAERGVKFRKTKRGEYKYLDKSLLSQVTTLIYGDLLVFILWVQPYFAVVIKNKDIAQAQEEYFDLLWKVAYKHK